MHVTEYVESNKDREIDTESLIIVDLLYFAMVALVQHSFWGRDTAQGAVRFSSS